MALASIAMVWLLFGCGGSTSSAGTPVQIITPDIVFQPAEFAHLSDGGDLLVRFIRNPDGTVRGEATLYQPPTSGEEPEVFEVRGSSYAGQVDLDLISLAEPNDDVDYTLEGTEDAQRRLNVALGAGPGVDPGDETPQQLQFQNESGSSAALAQVPSQPGRAGNYITFKLVPRNTGVAAFRYRLQDPVMIKQTDSIIDFNLGFRVCLECDTQFTDYSALLGSYWDKQPMWFTLTYYDSEGKLGYTVITKTNGVFRFPDDAPSTFVDRSPYGGVGNGQRTDIREATSSVLVP